MKQRSLLQKFRDLPWYGELGIFVLVTFLVTLSVWTTYGLLGREKQVSTIELLSWERVINIEAFRVVHYSRERSTHPDAYNVRTWTESRPVVTTTSNGRGGTSTSVKIVTDRYYEYDNNEWRHFRAVVAAGNDQEPHWPEYSLGVGPLGKENRVSDRPETYRVHVVNDSGVRRAFITEQEEWQAYNKGETVIAVLSGFGSVKGLERVEAE